MGTATIPRGGGTAAPAKGLPNQPGNPNEIKPFQRPSSPPPAQPPSATPPPSSEIKPFQRPSAPPAAAPQNEIRPFQRAPGLPSPGAPAPSPIRGAASPTKGGRMATWDTSGTDTAFQRGMETIKNRSDELDRLYPPLDPSKSKYSPEYERNPPPTGGATWLDDLERRGHRDRAEHAIERAKEAAKRAWDKLWNPAGNRPQLRQPIQHPPEEQTGPPQGAAGVSYRISYSVFLNGAYWTGGTEFNIIAPFYTIRVDDRGDGQGFFKIVDAQGSERTLIGGGINGKNGNNHATVTINSIRRMDTNTPDIDPRSVPTPTPTDFGLMPTGLPSPTPVRPPATSPPVPKPFPRSPQPSPAPTPKRAPRKAPAPTPNPNPNPSPDTPPSPAQGSPGYPSPGPAPAGPSTSTTTSTSPNISPKDGREKAPNQDPNEAPDPPQEPEMNCKDPCIGSIQEEQQEAKKDRDKKKPVKITVDVFKDCDGDNGSARFDKKEISVPADEADHLKLLYQQLATANALECRLDLSIAVPEEQIRRRPKFIPEMVLFFETVRKQSNGKRSNYSLTVFHWDKPKGIKPAIPNHTKGNHIKIVVLADGCRISTSGKTKQDANKVMTAILRNVPNELKKGRGFTSKLTTSFSSKNKEVEVRCIRGKYYKHGYQPGIRPDWVIDYRRKQTPTVD